MQMGTVWRCVKSTVMACYRQGVSKVQWAKALSVPVYDKQRKEGGCIEICVVGAPFKLRDSIQGLTKGMSQLQRKEAFHRS